MDGDPGPVGAGPGASAGRPVSYDREEAAREQAEFFAATRAARQAHAERERVDTADAVRRAHERMRGLRDREDRVPPERIVARFVVGTADDCDLRITGDPLVRDRHAVLTLLVDGSALVEPFGVAGSLYVLSPVPGRVGDFGRPPRRARRDVTQPVAIVPGDAVVVGRTELGWAKR